ncbi:hypothetical protein [Pontivivens ytuae]|nr:hypothetical protein [Pontivivens ytuae]
MDQLMRGTETRRFSVLEQTDDRLVLSSKPFLLRIAVPVFLSPFLLILVFLLIARLDGGPVPMGGYVEFALVLLPVMAGFAVVITAVLLLTSPYKLYEFDVPEDVVRYSQGHFPGRPAQIAVLRLSELGDLHIRRETFRFVRHGPVPASFIFTSTPEATFVLPTRNQDDEAVAFVKWIEAGKRRARNSVAE